MAFVNNVKLTKPLKSLVNSNGVFEYDTKLAPLNSPYVVKNKSQALVPQQRIIYDAAEKSKNEMDCSVWDWVIHTIWNRLNYILRYGFVSATNREG